MPVFEFHPTDLNDPSWSASTHKGAARVHAPDEATARQMLDDEFRVATDRRNPDGTIATSPWKDPERAECTGSVEPQEGEYLEGQIEVPSSVYRGGGGGMYTGVGVDREWRAVNEDRLPEDQTYQVRVSDTLHLNVNETATVRAVVTRETIRHVIQNRTVLSLQATTLLDFLDELLGAEGVPKEGRNAPPLADALGVSDAITEGELLEVLRDLRNELRRFNEALENQSVEPSTLTQFRDTAVKAAGVAFGTTLGAGGAGIIITAVGGLLDSAGLVPWDRFIEFIKAVRG